MLWLEDGQFRELSAMAIDPVCKMAVETGASVCADTSERATADSGAGSAAPASFPTPEWMQAHSAFHAALSAACTSPLLKHLRQQLFDSAELYRHWSVSLVAPTHRRPGGKEHKQMLDAALAHDVEAAVEQAAAHIRGTTQALLARREPGESHVTATRRSGSSRTTGEV